MKKWAALLAALVMTMVCFGALAETIYGRDLPLEHDNARDGWVWIYADRQLRIIRPGTYTITGWGGAMSPARGQIVVQAEGVTLNIEGSHIVDDKPVVRADGAGGQLTVNVENSTLLNVQGDAVHIVNADRTTVNVGYNATITGGGTGCGIYVTGTEAVNVTVDDKGVVEGVTGIRAEGLNDASVHLEINSGAQVLGFTPYVAIGAENKVSLNIEGTAVTIPIVGIVGNGLNKSRMDGGPGWTWDGQGLLRIVKSGIYTVDRLEGDARILVEDSVDGLVELTLSNVNIDYKDSSYPAVLFEAKEGSVTVNTSTIKGPFGGVHCVGPDADPKGNIGVYVNESVISSENHSNAIHVQGYQDATVKVSGASTKVEQTGTGSGVYVVAKRNATVTADSGATISGWQAISAQADKTDINTNGAKIINLGPVVIPGSSLVPDMPAAGSGWSWSGSTLLITWSGPYCVSNWGTEEQPARARIIIQAPDVSLDFDHVHIQTDEITAAVSAVDRNGKIAVNLDDSTIEGRIGVSISQTSGEAAVSLGGDSRITGGERGIMVSSGDEVRVNVVGNAQVIAPVAVYAHGFDDGKVSVSVKGSARIEGEDYAIQATSEDGEVLLAIDDSAIIIGRVIPELNDGEADIAPEVAQQAAALPQTGDSSSLALWGALLMLAGAALFVRRKREA